MLTRTGLAALAVAGLLSCGGETPEDRLEEALVAVREAEVRIEDGEERLAAERAELQACRQDLADAQRELNRARKTHSEAKDRLEQRATEVALFRAVQAALLEADVLESVAVRVEVSDGQIVLHGEVPSTQLREKAAAIARATPGVTKIESRIRVVGPSE